MEKQIICILNPFLFKQKVMVFENSNEIFSDFVEIDKINDSLFHLADKFKVVKIGLHSTDTYSQKIKEKLEQSNVTKYNKKYIIELV